VDYVSLIHPTSCITPGKLSAPRGVVKVHVVVEGVGHAGMPRCSKRRTWRERIDLEGGSAGKTAKRLSPVSMGVLQIALSWNIAGDLPDVSKCFRGITHAGDRRATLHGVVFDILGARAASASRLACRAGVRGRARLRPSQLRGVSFGVAAFTPFAIDERAEARTHDPVIKITGSLFSTFEQAAAIGCPHEHPVVLPHVSHFMQVPFRTSVKFPHSPHISPS